MGQLFPTLAADNTLPADELALLAALPNYPTVEEVDAPQHAAARRLERKGLVKIHREKVDPVAVRPTWYAGAIAQQGGRDA